MSRLRRPSPLRGFLLAACGFASAQHLVAPARAQCRCPRLLGTYDTPGQAKDVAVEGGIAYVADALGGLRIIDVSDPMAPVELGAFQSATPGAFARGVDVADGVAYVALDVAGLEVVDVADPTAPALLGSYATFSDAVSVTVLGDIAYVGESCIRMLDVSDPRAPTLLGSLCTPGIERGVAVSAGVAYVAADFWGLVLFDVSDPTSPASLGTYSAQGCASGVAD